MRTNSDEKNVDLISKVALCVRMSVCHRNYKLLQNCQYSIGVYRLGPPPYFARNSNIQVLKPHILTS